MKQYRTRMSLSLGDDDDQALAAIKQHYGISSNAAAVRRAIAEHAKQIKEPVKSIERVTYSRRIH